MPKKEESLSQNSEASEFKTNKKVYKKGKLYKNTHVQFTIYPENELIGAVKILAKVYDLNVNSMFIKLINEALDSPKHQKVIRAYMSMKTDLR